MTTILVLTILLLLVFMASVYSILFLPTHIDEEEARAIEKRHGRASRAYTKDLQKRVTPHTF